MGHKFRLSRVSIIFLHIFQSQIMELKTCVVMAVVILHISLRYEAESKPLESLREGDTTANNATDNDQLGRREAVLPAILALLALGGISAGAGAIKNGEKKDMKTRLNDASGNNQLRARYEGLPQAMNQKSKESLEAFIEALEKSFEK